MESRRIEDLCAIVSGDGSGTQKAKASWTLRKLRAGMAEGVARQEVDRTLTQYSGSLKRPIAIRIEHKMKTLAPVIEETMPSAKGKDRLRAVNFAVKPKRVVKRKDGMCAEKQMSIKKSRTLPKALPRDASDDSDTESYEPDLPSFSGVIVHGDHDPMEAVVTSGSAGSASGSRAAGPFQ